MNCRAQHSKAILKNMLKISRTATLPLLIQQTNPDFLPPVQISMGLRLYSRQVNMLIWRICQSTQVNAFQWQPGLQAPGKPDESFSAQAFMTASFLKNTLISLCVVACSGCSYFSPALDLQRTMTPMQAIEYAAERPDSGYSGQFGLIIKSVGTRGNTFLNSELDYRDQRNLSVELTPEAIQELQLQYGKTPQDLIGSRILVDGVARRVTIHIYNNGQVTKLYYYQTHITVNHVRQLHLL